MFFISSKKIVISIVIFSFVTIIKSETFSKTCSDLKTQDDCIRAGLENTTVAAAAFAQRLLIPLDNGRCCWDQTNNKCVFVEDPNPTFTKINNLVCKSAVENYCTNLKPKNIDDEEACQAMMMEPPYECCFVRYRYHAECMVLDTHDIDVYSRTFHHIKAARGWKDESKVEIICGANYMSKVFSLFLILFFTILL